MNTENITETIVRIQNTDVFMFILSQVYVDDQVARADTMMKFTKKLIAELDLNINIVTEEEVYKSWKSSVNSEKPS